MGSSQDNSSSVIRIGLGAFYSHVLENNFNTYFGPRIGFLFNSSTSHYTGSPETTTSETDFFIGFCTGGEYLLSSHFSLGGEVQLNYISFGEPDVSPSTSTSSRSQSIFTTNALVFFRWYF